MITLKACRHNSKYIGSFNFRKVLISQIKKSSLLPDRSQEYHEFDHKSLKGEYHDKLEVNTIKSFHYYLPGKYVYHNVELSQIYHDSLKKKLTEDLKKKGKKLEDNFNIRTSH